MQKELILHLGFHKTGSTSIQYSCAKNIKLLKQQNITYPLLKFFSDRNTSSNHSIHLFSLFTNHPEKYSHNITANVNSVKANQYYLSQFNEVLKSKTNRIIISGEDLSRLKKNELESFKKHIESFGWKIRTISYIRSPFQKSASSYSQYIKGGNYLPVASYQQDDSEPITYITEVFENPEFYSFNEICQKYKGPVQHFFHILKIRDIEKFKIVKVNEGISNHATRLICYLNQKEPLNKNGQLNEKRKIGDTKILQQLKGEKFNFNKQELQSMIPFFKQQNEWLKNRFGSDFCDNIDYNDKTLPNQCTWTDDNLTSFQSIMGHIPSHLLSNTLKYFKEEANLNKSQLRKVKEMFNIKLFNKIHTRELLEDNVDLFRDLAIKIEKHDLQTSYNLMLLALKGRPDGVVINNKIKKYLKLLSQSKKNT